MSKKNKKILIWSLIILAVVLAGAAGVYYWKKSKKDKTDTTVAKTDNATPEKTAVEKPITQPGSSVSAEALTDNVKKAAETLSKV